MIGRGGTESGGPDVPSQNRASESPGNGESAAMPATSTIVAARSRRLTVSLTTRFAALRPAERSRAERAARSDRGSSRGRKRRRARRSSRRGPATMITQVRSRTPARSSSSNSRRAVRRGRRCSRHRRRGRTRCPAGENVVLSRSHQFWISVALAVVDRLRPRNGGSVPAGSW